MRFALLGIDADALELADHIAHSTRHQLVWAGEVGTAVAQVRALAPAVEIGAYWESLLTRSTADAVIVARGGDEESRAEQLRKLVQESVPLLVAHPVHDSMLICYELDMIRRETGCVIMPDAPYRWHAGIERLAAIVAEGVDSSIGAPEQAVMERAMSERTRKLVERQFARDVDVLRGLVGELTSISALAPGGKEASGYANLGVQLAGESGVLVRWSVGPVEHAPGARLTLRCVRGKATLDMPGAGEPAALELVAGERTERETFPAWDPAAAAIERFERAIAGKPSAPDWPDACRDVELAESIARSLVKGRTIELHDEEDSEQGTFKGMMTSVGCGLLLAALVVLPIAAVLAKLTGKPIFGYAPHFILGVLALFLGIQFLKLVIPSQESK